MNHLPQPQEFLPPRIINNEGDQRNSLSKKITQILGTHTENPTHLTTGKDCENFATHMVARGIQKQIDSPNSTEIIPTLIVADAEKVSGVAGIGEHMDCDTNPSERCKDRGTMPHYLGRLIAAEWYQAAHRLGKYGETDTQK